MPQDIRSNVHALHCDDLDRIWSHMNIVYVHYFEGTMQSLKCMQQMRDIVQHMSKIV